MRDWPEHKMATVIDSASLGKEHVIGERAGQPFQVHAHMLRYVCGFALANAGHDTRAIQDWLGHRSIQHAVRYTELSPTRFKDFWRD
jgi:type 1 fimbriae regulatory protein FimB/type 1 fimbriae regulatory protein FimE